MDKLQQLETKEGDAKADYLAARADTRYKRKLYRLAKASRKRHQRLARLEAKRNKAASKADIVTEALKDLEAEAKGRKRITVTTGGK